MATDRSLISLADLVRHAAAIVDPEDEDTAVGEFVARFEDADEPVRGILEGLDERVQFGADENPAVTMAQAVVLYLAHRPDQFEDEPEQILQLAAKAEFDGNPPPEVARWLSGDTA